MAAPDDGYAARPLDGSKARTLHRVDELIANGLARPADASGLKAVAGRYAVAIPPVLATAIAATGHDGPLGRQFVPSLAELTPAADEAADPIGDLAHSPVPGIVHRYPDRVLLKPIQACAVYCRFCFRREQVGPHGDALDSQGLERAIAYIRHKPDIWEVILTGGDPLILSPVRIRDIVERLCAIDHVAVIRFHSRVPIATPERLTPDHVAALRLGLDRGRAVYVGLHCNHAEELGKAARDAIARIVDAGIPMLAQTVLLAGVNDDPATLERLFRALVALRVKPYYLHHLDAAPGTSGFRVPVEQGQALMRALRGRIPGHCLPEYVLDIPGGFGKVPIGPVYLHGAIVSDPHGTLHRSDGTSAP